jgi:hypothetical protein
MSNTKYKSQLYIITKEQTDPKGNVISDGERIDIPVHSFEVEGGVNRKLSLGSTDDVTVTSEFEQSRGNNNIVFYIPPTNDFLAVKIIELQKKFVFFEFDFIISEFSGKVNTQTLRLSSDFAWFFKEPVPEGGTPPLLKARVRFREAQILHGKLDSKQKKLVHKQI